MSDKQILMTDVIPEMGSMVRIAKLDIPPTAREPKYCVEFAPMGYDDDVMPDDDEFLTAGGTPGLGESCFYTNKEAERFIEDLQNVLEGEMSRLDFFREHGGAGFHGVDIDAFFEEE